jgi:phage gp36-like protein
MAYATASDMIKRFDSRVVGDLVADNGTSVDEDDLASNAKLTAALSSASGQLNAAVLQGERYTVADLTGLTGDGSEFLKQITCELAFGLLWQRKPYADDNLARKEATERMSDWLHRLRGGEWVFDVNENKEAGRPKVSTVTRIQARDENLIVDRMAGNYFPPRRTYRDR